MVGRFGSRSRLAIASAHHKFATIINRRQVPGRGTAFRVRARFVECIGWPVSVFIGMQASTHLQTVETVKVVSRAQGTCSQQPSVGGCTCTPGARGDPAVPAVPQVAAPGTARQPSCGPVGRVPQGAEDQPALIGSIHRRGHDPKHMRLPAMKEQVQRVRRQQREVPAILRHGYDQRRPSPPHSPPPPMSLANTASGSACSCCAAGRTRTSSSTQEGSRCRECLGTRFHRTYKTKEHDRPFPYDQAAEGGVLSEQP